METETKFCPRCNDSHVCVITEPNPRARLAAPDNHAGVGTFILDACDIDEKNKCGGSALYRAYLNWSEREGLKPFANNQFALAVQGHGFKRRVSGTTTYYGLKPRTALAQGVADAEATHPFGG